MQYVFGYLVNQGKSLGKYVLFQSKEKIAFNMGKVFQLETLYAE